MIIYIKNAFCLIVELEIATSLHISKTLLHVTEQVFYKHGLINLLKKQTEGAQWLSGRVLDSRLRGRRFEPHRCNRPEFPPVSFFPGGKNGPVHSFPGEKIGRPILSPGKKLIQEKTDRYTGITALWSLSKTHLS